MSTPSSMVGEQHSTARSPLPNASSRSMRFSAVTWPVCSPASMPAKAIARSRYRRVKKALGAERRSSSRRRCNDRARIGSGAGTRPSPGCQRSAEIFNRTPRTSGAAAHLLEQVAAEAVENTDGDRFRHLAG